MLWGRLDRSRPNWHAALFGDGTSTGHVRCWVSPQMARDGDAQHGEAMGVKDSEERTELAMERRQRPRGVGVGAG